MTLSLGRILATTGFAIVLAVAAIGVVRATAPAPSTSPAPAALAAPAELPTTGTGALDDQVAGELDAVLAANQTATAQAAPAGRNARGQLRRLAAWRHLVHATVVVELDKVGLTTIQLDHGTISAVSASSLTISETGGGSVTIALGSDTRVRRDGAKAAVTDLKAADEIFVMSKVEPGGSTAYLVVVPKA
ncbi:MAG: hypothetical protein QOI00_2284 [Chloroflexota bacterium]|nr:hypothetical protein [Chloroflexota bacterium]